MNERDAARPRTPPFLTVGRLIGAVAIWLAPALVPPAPFAKPLLLMRLSMAPAPTRVALPVDGVRESGLRDGWGSPRSDGRSHQGIDIFAPRGTRVVASTDGLVWRVGSDPLGGRVVWVLGPARQMHYYAHLDRQADLRAGDRVAAGDTLGTVGTSGNARGGPPHLHYGIYDGTDGAINPFPLLTGRVAASPRSATPSPNPDADALRPAAPSVRSRTAPRPAS